MRDLTREEIVAMWLHGAAYARSGLGAIEWWKRLGESDRNNVLRFLKELDDATQPAKSKRARSRRAP